MGFCHQGELNEVAAAVMNRELRQSSERWRLCIGLSDVV